MQLVAWMLWAYALTVAAPAPPAKDQAAVPSPVWCMLVPEQRAVSVEEPIWLHLQCENRGAEDAVMDLQSGVGVGWRVLPSIATLSCSPHLCIEGVPPGRIVIPARGKVALRALLNRWSGKIDPGSYRLSLVSCVGGFEQGYKGGQSLSNEVTLKVLQLDAQRLERIGKQLSQDALNPANTSEVRLQAAEALAWIDLPFAAPYLQEVLLQAKDASAMLAACGLGRIGSPDAVRVMVDAYDKVSVFVQMEIRGTLTTMHPVALDPELQRRVEHILQDTVRFVD